MSDIESPFGELDESLVKSVLEQSGFSDTVEELSSSGAAEETPQEQESDSTVKTTEPPPAPGGPLFPEEPDDKDVVTLSDGTKYPIALIEEWAKERQRPTYTPPPEPTPTEDFTRPTIPGLPQLTEEDLEMAGPVGRAALMILNAQAQEMAELRKHVSAAQQVQQQNAEVEASKVLNAAQSSFKQEFNLPDDLMEKISNNAVPDDVKRYMANQRPEDRNPYEAVRYALERSYWNLPDARQFEFERQAAARQAAVTRKQKLAGVSGGPGPSTRGAPVYDESTQEGRHAAAVELVRQAMYGDEQ